jgi:hypothetical protein
MGREVIVGLRSEAVRIATAAGSARPRPGCPTWTSEQTHPPCPLVPEN